MTRYLFRSTETELLRRARWDSKALDEAAFGALVRNLGEWCERNSAADTPAANLFSVLIANRPALGDIAVRGVVTPGADSKALIDGHLTALQRDVGPPKSREVHDHAWLDFVLNPLPDLFAVGPGGVAASPVRLKAKDALLRRRHTDRQIAVAYDYLARKDLDVPGGSLGLATYGGRVNTVAPDATAAAQRASVMVTSYGVGWGAAEEDARSLDWVRRFYADVFAESGGVPVPGEQTEGALINHPDSDLADPAWNRSGASFGSLYCKDNYPRLQRIKAQWDPRDVFRHALSIRLPERA